MILALSALTGIMSAGAVAPDLLSTSAGAMHAAKSVSLTYTAMRVGETAFTYKADLAKPNLARIESDSQLIVADGSSIVVFNKKDKTYDKRQQTDTELKALFASDDRILLAPFFDLSFASRFTSPVAGGKKAVRGVTYDLVSTTGSRAGEKRTAKFYVDPADKLAKVAEITTDGILLVVIKEITTDLVLPASLFTFAIPVGATNLSADAPAKVPRTQMPNLNGFNLLPAVGLTSCCPTATTNGLLWLAMNGYDDLLPSNLADSQKASWLAGELATKYYKTDTTIGTTWPNMFTGLPGFLRDRGYPNSKLGLYAWLKFPEANRISLGSEIPDLDTIKRLQTRDAFVMIAIGFFNNPDGSGRATRANWHWATLVDVLPSEGAIVLHDPMQPKNPQSKPWRLQVTRFPAGSKVVLVDSSAFKNPDKPAADVPIIDKYLNVNANQFAIIEGVLVVKVAK
jgi:outer membrane lipoprotein-sorting protein